MALHLSTNPVKILQSLSNLQQKIVGRMISYYNSFDTVFPSYEYIAKEINYSASSVKLAMRHLKELGLFNATRRYNSSSVYTLSPIFFMKEVRSYIHDQFNIYLMRNKALPFCLSLLISTIVSYSGEERYRELQGSLNPTDIYISFDGVSSRARTRCAGENTPPPIKKRTDLGSELHSQRIVNICRALKKRGAASISNDDALALYAFSPEVLEHVCDQMKHATPRNPIAFFISEAKKRAQWLNQPYNYELVNYARDNKIVLLEASFFAEDLTGSQKRERRETSENKQLTYTEQLAENKAREARLESKSLRQTRDTDSDKELSAAIPLLDPTNPFAAILLEGWKKRDEALAPDKLAAPVVSPGVFSSIKIPDWIVNQSAPPLPVERTIIQSFYEKKEEDEENIPASRELESPMADEAGIAPRVERSFQSTLPF